VAAIVTLGCLFFVMSGKIVNTDKDDSTYGLLLMALYLMSDGFTSTLQEQLFRGYEMSTYNQMLYVNLCSAIISLVTLVSSGELLPSIQFSLSHTDFMINSFILSAAASFGQMIILITIKEFGALFFATVMTVRQVVSIILSCIIYLHPLTWMQWISSGVVFGILYWKDATKPRSGHHHSHKPTSTSSTSPPENVQLVVDKK